MSGKSTTVEWSERNVELLKSGVADGLSYAEIAKQIGQGATRSACIGKAKRLGIGQTPEAARFNQCYASSVRVGWGNIEAREDILRRRREKVEARFLPRKARAPRPRPEPIGSGHVRTPPNPPPRAIPQGSVFDLTDDAIPLVGRPPGSCAWPVGDPATAADQLCCGHKTAGRTYCPDHVRIRAGNFTYGLFAGGANELIRSLRRVI